MPVSRIALGLLAILVLTSSACSVPRTLPALSPRAQLVRVEKAEPPAGARLVGPIEVTDGKGCGIGGDLGTPEAATFSLKEAAAQRGIQFVKVTRVEKPYSGHDCYHQEYTIRGLGYALPEPAPSASAAPAPPPAPPAPPAIALPPAPPVVAPPPAAAEALPPTKACEPPCSPGYECRAGVCEALCNPACGEGRVCRSDRVCVPAVPK